MTDIAHSPWKTSLILAFLTLMLLAACTHNGPSFEEIEGRDLAALDEPNPSTESGGVEQAGSDSALDEFLNKDLEAADDKVASAQQAINEAEAKTEEQTTALPNWDHVAQTAPQEPNAAAGSQSPEAVSPMASEAGLLAPPVADPVTPAEVVPSVSEPTAPKAIKKPKLSPLPRKVVRKKGQALNRYYFIRKGDTPESLSNLFYGVPDHAGELVEWNGPSKSWRPGKLVLYISSWQPDDSEFLSFYEEQGIEPEKYVLRKGESLGNLAASRYGDKRSWKEIALMNRLSTMTNKKEGREIVLYPANPVPIKVRDVAEVAVPAPVVAPPVPVSEAISLPSPEEKAKAERLSEIKRRKNQKLASAKLPESGVFSFALWGFLITSALCLILVWQYRKAKEEAEFLD